MSGPFRRRRKIIHRGYERLNALSDGVVAIAITLLVFPITDLATSSHAANVLTIVHDHEFTFLGFIITFLVIANLWVDSNRLFRDVRGYTAPLVWTHMVWLLSIVFLPFPMDVLASANDAVFPNAALYVGTLLVATTALFAEYVFVSRSPGLQRSGNALPGGLIDAAVDMFCILAAFLVTLAMPQWGLRPLFILIFAAFAGPFLGRRYGSRRAATHDHSSSPARRGFRITARTADSGGDRTRRRGSHAGTGS